MQIFSEWINNCGPIGFFILLLFVALVPAGVVMFRKVRSRGPFLVYLCLALLPLGLGLLGTALGYAEVRDAELNSGSEGTREDVEIGRKNARYSTHMGITATVPLLLIGLAGVATRRTADDPEDTPQQ